MKLCGTEEPDRAMSLWPRLYMTHRICFIGREEILEFMSITFRVQLLHASRSTGAQEKTEG